MSPKPTSERPRPTRGTARRPRQRLEPPAATRRARFPALSLAAFLGAFSAPAAAAGPLAPGEAWAEKAGRIVINQPPLPSDLAQAEATYLTGYLWGPSLGWIHLGDTPAGGITYSNATADDYGVNVEPDGRLNGYAWAEKLGWIQLGPGPGAFLDSGNRLSGMAWSRAAGWITFVGPSVALDLFSDQDGDQVHDPGEETVLSNPGSSPLVLADVTNEGGGRVTAGLALRVEGLPGATAEVPAELVLLAGASRRLEILLQVPENAPAGTYPVVLAATGAGGAATARALLEVRERPLITGLFAPDGAATGSATFHVCWRTSVPTTGKLILEDPRTGNQREVQASPEPATFHCARATLQATEAFWWVEATDASGNVAVAPEDAEDPSQARPRLVVLALGATFNPQTYRFKARRDYDQRFGLSVQNLSQDPVTVTLALPNPYPDIAVGFIDEGSAGEPLTLSGGEKRTVTLALHLQDADPTRTEPYRFAAQLLSSRAGEPVVTDTAAIEVEVVSPNVDFTVEPIAGPAPGTLAVTCRITNRGDPLTDLEGRPADDLAGLVVIVPSIRHAQLGSGESLTFDVVPVVVGPEPIRGTLLVSAAGVTQAHEVDFTPPVAEDLYTFELEDVLYCSRAVASSCTNRRRIGVDLDLPPGIERDAVLSAVLTLSIRPGAGQRGSPYDLDVSLNGRVLGRFRQTLPSGIYRFQVPPDALNVSAEEPTVNRLLLVVSNVNQGNFYIASDMSLCLCLSSFTCRLYAPSEADARARCLERPGLQLGAGDLTAQVTFEPDPPVEREPVTLEARVDPALDDLVIEARFSNGDPAIVLARAGGGAYRGTWRPSCAGDVTVEIHAETCPPETIGAGDVTVTAGPTVELPVPSYSPGGTAWDWAATLSGLLRYYGRSVKPWSLAAGLGASPSSGLAFGAGEGGNGAVDIESVVRHVRDVLRVPAGLEEVAAGDQGLGALQCLLRSGALDGRPSWLALAPVGTGAARCLLFVGSGAAGAVFDDPRDGPGLRSEQDWPAFLQVLLPGPESRLAVLSATGAPRPRRPLSLNLPPGVPDGATPGLLFRHGPDGQRALRFLWHGGAPLGYVLGHPESDPAADPEEWPAPDPVFPADPLTGSGPLLGDALELALEVTNAGTEAAEVQVRVEVEQVRTHAREELGGEGIEIDLGPRERRSVPVVLDGDARVFDIQGTYALRAFLLAGGEVQDDLEIRFTVHCPPAVRFRRGDVGARKVGDSQPADGLDQRLNLTDAIRILQWLFRDRALVLDCEKAADADDSGVINLTDAVYVLLYLFGGGAPPPEPFETLDLDPTPDDLECCRYPGGGP